MKKILYTLLIVSALSVVFKAQAYEFKPYVGVNVTETTNIKFKFSDGSGISDTVKEDKKEMFGINLGSMLKFNNNTFIFGEANINIWNKFVEYDEFYQLSSVSGVYNTVYKNDYSFKLGFGYNFFEKFNFRLFATLDSYEHKSYDEDTAGGVNYEKWDENGTGYGLGFGYNLTENLDLDLDLAKKSYDYGDVDWNVKVKLTTLTLGLKYVF